MRQVIVILSLLLIAAVADAQLPYRYECHAEEKYPLEIKLCSSLAAAMERSDTMLVADDSSVPYFHLTILPTARGGYISVMIASNLIYPPLNGLALSAYLAGFLIEPGKLDVHTADEMMNRVSIGTARWVIGSEPAIRAIPIEHVNTGLYACLEAGDE